MCSQSAQSRTLIQSCDLSSLLVSFSLSDCPTVSVSGSSIIRKKIDKTIYSNTFPDTARVLYELQSERSAYIISQPRQDKQN